MTIRVGDTIRIEDPQIFVRCGYPLTLKQAIEDVKLDPKISKQMHELYCAIVEKYHPRVEAGAIPVWTTVQSLGSHAKRLWSALGYLACDVRGFGGVERKIYTELKEEYRGEFAEVTEKRVVMTGEYYPASGGMTYDGESDWEPGGLANRKTNVILSCVLLAKRYRNVFDERVIEIEQVRVKKFPKFKGFLFQEG